MRTKVAYSRLIALSVKTVGASDSVLTSLLLSNIPLRPLAIALQVTLVVSMGGPLLIVYRYTGSQEGPRPDQQSTARLRPL